MKEVKTPKKPLAIYYTVVLLVLLLLNLVLVPWMSERQVKEVDYGTFMSMTEEKNIGRVDIESNQIIFTDKDETQVYRTGLMNDPSLTERLYDAGAAFSSEIVEQTSPILSFLLWFVLPIVLFTALGNFMNKKLMEKMGGPNSMMFGGMGKSNAKVYVQSTEGIHFADVAGEDEAKENLQEVVNYLHDPSKYKDIGAQMPKGILLVGPPGTGKTMLAKAVAGESNVPFFSMSGSEFVEMFVGMGASKVRDLFKQAKEKAPCIVFIDEIDTIGKKRDGQFSGGNDELDREFNLIYNVFTLPKSSLYVSRSAFASDESETRPSFVTDRIAKLFALCEENGDVHAARAQSLSGALELDEKAVMTACENICPMKEELKEKDIIYLYITGETSPKGTWENMISDIHGEHFRVTNEQWNFLMSNLNIEGVPTYFIIDPEGNITYKKTGFPGVETMKEQLLKTLNK